MHPFILSIHLFLSAIAASCAGNDSTAGAEIAEPQVREQYKWTKLLDSAPFPESYNFQMFAMDDYIYVFHPAGVWKSGDGKSWEKTGLANILINQAFLDYVVFGDAVFALGTLEGNIERQRMTSQIARTRDFESWEIVAIESNLPPRFFYHPFVFDNKIWIIGGQDKQKGYSDIWNSPDGVAWTKQKDKLPFGKRGHSQIVNLNGRLFLLNNDVWTSTDALNWQKVTDEIVAGENIFGYAAVVYDDKIWLLGCNRNGQFSSQVLVSEDGKHWTGHDAPWSPRGGVAAAVLDGKIYMTGGKYGGLPNQPDFRYSNDVWVLERGE